MKEEEIKTAKTWYGNLECKCPYCNEEQTAWCHWSLATSNKKAAYKLECGGYHTINVKSLSETTYKYCPYCGKRIKEVTI